MFCVKSLQSGVHSFSYLLLGKIAATWVNSILWIWKMPDLKRICSWPGCRCLVTLPERYCEKHKPRAEAKQKACFNRGKRNASELGYNYAWQRARKQFLLDHPLCQECQRNGRITAANVVDHITPHKGNQELFWDQSNWQALCQSCHSKKTAREDGGFGNAMKAGGG